MKKIIIIFLVLFAFVACQKLEPLNENKKDFKTVTGEGLYNGAVRALFNQLGTKNVNSNNTQLYMQYFAETTYPDESRYDMVTRPIPALHMNRMYRLVLMNLKESSLVFKATPIVGTGITEGQRNNQLAIVEIMSVYTWSNIVETYGNMPYSEALDIKRPSPKYDDAFTIYKNLIDRLGAAIAKLDVASKGMPDGYDNIFEGDMAKWMRFANTLKMRMGLVLADVDPVMSVKIVNEAEPKAFIEGDKFALSYLKDSPNTNPVYTEVVIGGREDFVATNVFIKPLNELKDPRIDKLWLTQIEKKDTVDPNKKIKYYEGGIPGDANSYDSYSHLDKKLLKPSNEFVLMDYAEAEFLRAEAAARGGYAVADPAAHYNNAIKASIKSWGGADDAANAYLAQPQVAYATAKGDWKEKIGTQAWYAYYMRGFSAWLTWRRLDQPRLIAVTKHVPQVNGIPIRYTYAVSEQTLNGDNYQVAAKAIGGDNAMTPLFWDKFQYNYFTGADK